MSVTKFGLRFLRDADGQVLLFGAIVILVLFVFMLAIPNATRVATQKMRAQTAADVGAFTGSVWLARALNLNANMNVGIKSMYTWATVLTVGSALAQALYSDTVASDTGAQQMGLDLVSALFNTSSTPPQVSLVEYPAAVESLNVTSHWLFDLQDSIVATFHDVAAELGTEEACQNAGANPPDSTAGGWVLVKSNDETNATPLLVGGPIGDSLMLADLRQIAGGLESLPTGSPNFGPAVGRCSVDQNSLDIYAYYGYESEWMRIRYFMHYTMFWIGMKFRDSATGLIDTQFAYFDTLGRPPYANFRGCKLYPTPRAPGDSWAPWLPWAHNIGRHYPPYQLLAVIEGGNAKYKIDTFWWVPNNLPKWLDTMSWEPGGDSVPELPGKNWEHDSTKFYVGYFEGADSTECHAFDKISPRRVNPDRWFHATSYVWRQGASTSPYGMGAPMGGSLFPRSKVASVSPLLTVARSVPYMAVDNALDYDYYFTPGWDARLTPFDSVGVAEIEGDTAVGGYAIHTRDCFANLQDLRRYVLLP